MSNDTLPVLTQLFPIELPFVPAMKAFSVRSMVGSSQEKASGHLIQSFCGS
uniref:Uncharacterized protein n=1 Tax=Brassica oleracea TaxID=3712 RepID=A0A3P6CA24_BRAOL|nr:unnamed protein product [Brassica oleracea]